MSWLVFFFFFRMGGAEVPVFLFLSLLMDSCLYPLHRTFITISLDCLRCTSTECKHLCLTLNIVNSLIVPCARAYTCSYRSVAARSVPLRPRENASPSVKHRIEFTASRQSPSPSTALVCRILMPVSYLCIKRPNG